MTRKHFSLLLLLFFTFSLSAQTPDVDYSLSEMELSGPVRSMSISVQTFDSLGNVTTRGYAGRRNFEVEYSPTGQFLSCRTMYTGQRNYYLISCSYENGLLKSMEKRFVTDTSQIIEEAYSFSYKLNRKKLPVKRKQINSKGGFVSQMVYKYSVDGKLLESELNVDDTSDHYTNGRMLFTYNDSGQVTQITDPVFAFTTDFTYENGVVTSKHYKDPQFGEEEILTYVNGVCVQKLSVKEGKLPVTRINTYEFDSQGNWIKCTCMKDGKFETISRRTILYY